MTEVNPNQEIQPTQYKLPASEKVKNITVTVAITAAGAFFATAAFGATLPVTLVVTVVGGGVGASLWIAYNKINKHKEENTEINADVKRRQVLMTNNNNHVDQVSHQQPEARSQRRKGAVPNASFEQTRQARAQASADIHQAAQQMQGLEHPKHLSPFPPNNFDQMNPQEFQQQFAQAKADCDKAFQEMQNDPNMPNDPQARQMMEGMNMMMNGLGSLMQGIEDPV